MGDDTTSVTAALFGLAGFEILAAAEVGGELELLVQTSADLVGCPECGAVARAKDRRPTWVRDLPLGGRPVVVCWSSRSGRARTRCVNTTPGPSSTRRTRRARGMTERARVWALEQVTGSDAAVSRVATGLGVAWWTIMPQVIDRAPQ